MCDVADRFDQETYSPCIPIDLVDRRFPVLGQHIGCVACFHAQSSKRARWRLHDCPFDGVKADENRFDPSCSEFIKGVLHTRLDRRLFGRMCSRAVRSVLVAAQLLDGEQFPRNCVELSFKREQRRIVCGRGGCADR